MAVRARRDEATCLWLTGLPPLVPTDIVEGREARVWKMGPSPERWRERSRTFPGIAAAMAAQWGAVLVIAVAICGVGGWR